MHHYRMAPQWFMLLKTPTEPRPKSVKIDSLVYSIENNFEVTVFKNPGTLK